MNWKNALLYLARIIGLAVIYHLAARLGLQMAYVQQNTSPVWPPSGIALAALLLAGIRYWPGIALGVVAGSLLTGAPLGMALGFGTANTLEALIAAVLLKKWIKFDVNPPERVDIPRLFELEGVYDRQMWDGVVRDPADFALRNRLRFWFDNQDRARAAYASVTVKADACTDCRYCEPRCPYRLPIVSKLRHAHYKLSGAAGALLSTEKPDGSVETRQD